MHAGLKRVGGGAAGQARGFLGEDGAEEAHEHRRQAAIAGPDGLPERSELLAEPAVAALAEERLQRPVEIQQRTQRLLIATQTPWDLAPVSYTHLTLPTNREV